VLCDTWSCVKGRLLELFQLHTDICKHWPLCRVGHPCGLEQTLKVLRAIVGDWQGEFERCYTVCDRRRFHITVRLLVGEHFPENDACSFFVKPKESEAGKILYARTIAPNVRLGRVVVLADGLGGKPCKRTHGGTIGRVHRPHVPCNTKVWNFERVVFADEDVLCNFFFFFF